MGLGLRLVLIQKHELRLTHAQRQQLSTLLLQLQLLRHPEFPGAARGLEGMLAGHRLLVERNARGILVGGLSEDVWNSRTTPEKLAAHKDVDIMVLDPHFSLERKLEAGVDWWLPRTERVSYRTDKGFGDVVLTFYQNAFGITLSFGARLLAPESQGLEPGLYIPNREFVINMRCHEATDKVGESVEIEERAQERNKEKLQMRIHEMLPKFINTALKKIWDFDLEFIPLPAEYLISIRRLVEKEAE